MISASPPFPELPPLGHRGKEFSPQRIVLAGWRWLAEYVEPQSGDSLWADLPTSHGLYLPLRYDPQTRETLGDTSLAWWAEPLVRAFQEPRRRDVIPRVERRRAAERWLVLNTLDFIWGHSLLILLNAQHYLERYPDHGLIVVCTPALRPFVPEGTAEVWELPVTSPQETLAWHEPLAELFAARAASAPTWVARTVSHPEPGRYSPARFGLAVGHGSEAREESPWIIFNFRGDRCWGGSVANERRRLARLGEHLRRLWPRARLEIHGFATLPQPVHNWLDRTRRADGNDAGGQDYNARWTEELRTADLALGAYGSGMLRPTAVCPAVIALVPLDKQPYAFQECLFHDAQSANLRAQFWRLRFLYGNSTLSDIAPRQVAHLVNTLLTMERCFQLFQGAAFADPEPTPEQQARIAKIFSQEVAADTRRWHANAAALDRLSLASRLWQWLRRQASERD